MFIHQRISFFEMYTPSSFSISDMEVIRAFVADHSFAQLSSYDGEQIAVSHLPLLWRDSSHTNGELIGHFAKANPHWKHADGQEVLAVFKGPHAYISSSWYETPQSVPTWNYTAVHVSGQLKVINDKKSLGDDMRDLVDAMETNQATPWSMDDAAPEFIEKLLDMIVGFRIEIEKIECKFKLSQNHSEERRGIVIDALSQQTNDNSQQIADLMRSQLKD